MDFRELRYIQAIAEYQTISRAAEALYLSQPSLSLFLQKLENQLNVQLFERVNKRMYPTYAGQRYLEYAEQILQSHENLQKEIRNIAEEKSGYLSVGSTPTRTRYVIPELLTAFHRRYPDFMIDVKEAHPDELMQMLNDHTLDFALLTVPARDSRHCYYRLNQEEIVLCASADRHYGQLAVPRDGFLYPWIDLRLLQDELFLLVADTWRTGRCARRCCAQYGISPASISFSIVETAVAAAGSGLGISFCPDIMIRRGTFTHTPDYFSVGETPSPMEFVLVHRQDFPLTGPFRDFIRLAREILGESPAGDIP